MTINILLYKKTYNDNKYLLSYKTMYNDNKYFIIQEDV